MAWKETDETERRDFGGGRAAYGLAAGVVLDAAGGLAVEVWAVVGWSHNGVGFRGAFLGFCSGSLRVRQAEPSIGRKSGPASLGNFGVSGLQGGISGLGSGRLFGVLAGPGGRAQRSEEHTPELQPQ